MIIRIIKTHTNCHGCIFNSTLIIIKHDPNRYQLNHSGIYNFYFCRYQILNNFFLSFSSLFNVVKKILNY